MGPGAVALRSLWGTGAGARTGAGAGARTGAGAGALTAGAGAGARELPVPA